ncbi:helix-turn-helix transcriptional regulator [Bradyrhizobium sp. AZCC 1577]|uniref:helix-turn-helix transcriptional regulator n=1 Tax=Bradyrhizobium sp. AZCC 1577 TaxID=3117019 RepID=UPI002FF2AD31
MNTVSHLRSVSEGAFHNQQQLSDLIGIVYDAAIDPSLWQRTLERVALFVGGSGAGLFCKDVGVPHAAIPHSVGFERPLPVALFRQIYSAAEGHFLGDLEVPIATTDLMPFADYAQTDFYRQWAEPQGLVDFLSAVLDRTVISSAIFGVFRHKRNGMVDDYARRQMRLIAPHIRRAVLIGRLFEFKAAELATFVDALDGLGAGMYLVDAAGRLIHANAAGNAILGTSDILSSVGGRLAANDAQVDRALRDVFAAAGQGDAALGNKGIAVPLIGSDGERYVAHALPLTSGARRRAGVVHTAAAALFVRKAALAVSSAPQAIGSAFKLTPTELRVLLAIVEVGGIPEVAIAFGVADTTIRTHVSRLFEKTGTARQADLVKLVAGYATPLTD